ncbi:TetR/AcrR family transcriptional regulator [Nonomuraea sp. SYSU D8015]|uniref:TetR/AcrR family transcriptional regulator n=1 Tax=Nonomuraea sp. SYSU D8015 TaxID=2593644 RepID=UPI001CB6C2CC|nr:TetR/AcrR family transcriptional regulator [Nonomuraea sp. SYSU D8015]
MLTPRKQPRQQRSRETVAAILEAAAQLFQRHGYADTTTNKIAERAGVSIGSLYQYFPNKDALLVALAERHLAQSAEQVAQVFARAAEHRPSLHDLLTDLVGCVAALHTDRPALHRLLFDQAPRTPGLVARFRQAEQQIAHALAGELRRLRAGGPDPGLSALLAVQGIEGQLHGTLLDPPSDRDTTGHLQAAIRLWHQALAEPTPLPSGPSRAPRAQPARPQRYGRRR